MYVCHPHPMCHSKVDCYVVYLLYLLIWASNLYQSSKQTCFFVQWQLSSTIVSSKTIFNFILRGFTFIKSKTSKKSSSYVVKSFEIILILLYEQIFVLIQASSSWILTLVLINSNLLFFHCTLFLFIFFWSYTLVNPKKKLVSKFKYLAHYRF